MLDKFLLIIFQKKKANINLLKINLILPNLFIHSHSQLMELQCLNLNTELIIKMLP